MKILGVVACHVAIKEASKEVITVVFPRGKGCLLINIVESCVIEEKNVNTAHHLFLLKNVLRNVLCN